MTQFGSRRAAGLLAAIAVTALITALIFPVKTIAPPISAGILYLLGVLLVASFWGARLGMFTALLSGLAFNFFHIPPTGRFTIAKQQDGVAFLIFLLVAIAVSAIADQARRRTQEAEQRRLEADLSAETARLLLGGRAGAIAWCLDYAPGEIVVLRPGDEAPARRRVPRWKQRRSSRSAKLPIPVS